MARSMACEVVQLLRDEASGLRGVLVLHSTVAGPAFGGIRRRAYGSLQHAQAEAEALAEAMTLKCALAGLPAGGGKTTLVAPRDGEVDWPAAYRAVGDAVASLQGRYVCGPDVGTGTEELAWVRERCDHVNPAGNDAGASTAAGVLAGLRAVWNVLGTRGAHGRRVAIQGLGCVGGRLVAALVAQGAEVIAADPAQPACAAAQAMGATIVSPREIVAVPCDVLVPCALGRVLTEASVRTLRCRAVCGSANNQLDSAAAAWAMHRRGIVHAPDEVVSAGAVIEGVLTVAHGTGVAARREVSAAIERIEATLDTVLAGAACGDLPPSVVARTASRGTLQGR